ncbi:MAG: YggS family pyridoxal phosphate-dependent enzyme [Bacteroidota bacterium]
MVNIKANIQQLRKEIPENVKLVVVSKTRTNEDVMTAYDAGERVFGENRVQELIAKQPDLPSDIKWHMIGHLQTNKVKYIAGWVSMIEAVDRMKLLRHINKEAKKHERVIPCLLQFHIAEEETKFGLDIGEAEEILSSKEFEDMGNVKICGVMGMATFTEDMKKVRREFQHLKNMYDQIKRQYFADDAGFSEISMGMSNDYKVALDEGATMLRLGSTIFGPREI